MCVCWEGKERRGGRGGRREGEKEQAGWPAGLVLVCGCVRGKGGGGVWGGRERSGGGGGSDDSEHAVSVQSRAQDATNYGGRVPVDTTPSPAPVCRAHENTPRQLINVMMS